MTNEQLRALVRDAVARQLGTAAATAAGCAPPLTLDRSASCDHDRFGTHEPHAAPPGPPTWRQHPSHHIYLTVVNATDACVIEPSVTCDHCGYCKSHGH